MLVVFIISVALWSIGLGLLLTRKPTEKPPVNQLGRFTLPARGSLGGVLAPNAVTVWGITGRERFMPMLDAAIILLILTATISKKPILR